MKIGTDIIEIDRIAKAIKKPSFLKKCFTPSEASLIEERGPKAAAANFAAKEAIAKALGTGYRGFSPKDIEILRDKKGKPYANLYGKAKAIAHAAYLDNIEITISHNKTCAVAFVLLFNTENKIVYSR